MLKVFIAKFDVQPWDLTHQVEVTEWRARIWGEALKSQGVEDMELARVWPRHPLLFSFVCKHTACSAAE
jgi:hypothetical protein